MWGFSSWVSLSVAFHSLWLRWSFLGLWIEQMKSDFICCSQVLVKLVNLRLWCEEWIVCFILQFPLRSLKNKEVQLGTDIERSFKNVSFALLTEQLNTTEGSTEETLAVFPPSSHLGIGWPLPHASSSAQLGKFSGKYHDVCSQCDSPVPLVGGWNWFEQTAVGNERLWKSVCLLPLPGSSKWHVS